MEPISFMGFSPKYKGDTSSPPVNIMPSMASIYLSRHSLSSVMGINTGIPPARIIASIYVQHKELYLDVPFDSINVVNPIIGLNFK
ncbi:hypothetical protein SDC9_132374 [bioreactor metagenome]|uniref:Uncharacterized protein n=1 Tax=bioreactor metagenome TaxID=1076179 RepID=A0A645D7F5_9ZZZZ